MEGKIKAPTTVQVITAIARREIMMATRRRLVKLLFLGNLIPPIVMAVILVVNMIAKGLGADLDFDPLAKLLDIQTAPVLFLALAIGTPIVARDRSEDVLFLYATRPVTPWSYTIGKMLAVALPAVALLLIPGILIAVLRAGLIAEFGIVESLDLLVRIALVAVLVAWGYAGVTVGPSAAAKKTRWALLLAFGCFIIPASLAGIIWRGSSYALDPGTACEDLIATLFDGYDVSFGIVGAITLVVWGALGALVTSARVRKEMIP
jgi:ABC-type transport system involved in multi-copper enzyme maturation permease subunit